MIKYFREELSFEDEGHDLYVEVNQLEVCAQKLAFYQVDINSLLALGADETALGKMQFVARQELQGESEKVISAFGATRYTLKEDPFVLLTADYLGLFDEDEQWENLRVPKTIYDYFSVFEKQLFTEVIELKTEVKEMKDSLQRVSAQLERLLNEK